ncbi:MAG: CARDB domain-containing protein [Candidatus Bathyarchaeota archaeon]|nr:CARDB domain-containing protein [Candidatus Bathyarchaeota archaeon]
MNYKWKISISLLVILLAAIIFSNGLTFSESKNLASAQESSTRTVNYKIYSFFDVPIDADVWARRYDIYGSDYLISDTYPVVYLWEPETGWIYYYTSVRVNVQGRNLPEVKIDNPMFLPYNLMGGLEPGVVGGTAQIINWYLFFINSTRKAQIGFPHGLWDGYVSELTGKIILDKSAARKILGITETQFNNFASWWATNKGTVKNKWSTWLTNLGGAGGIFDIRPMFDGPYVDYPKSYTYYLDLESATADSITLKVDMITNGMDCLLARMFRATFMPGLEGFYDDLHFNATIRADSADVDLDTAWTWAMYMWSYDDTAFAEPTWMMEPIFGDYPDLAESYGVTTSPAYPYHNKTYYIVTPGNYYYNDYGLYDYTPNCFNLKEGETLTIDWSNTQKGPVWVFKQNPWTPSQTPNDTLTVVTGWLKFSESSEPYPMWIQSDPQINYNPTARTITFTGPLNFTELSQQYIPEEWNRINGLLPWGCPLIEFKVVSDHDIGVTNITPNKHVVGEGYTININVTLVNLGQQTENFNVKVYANGTQIATTPCTLTKGTSTTLTLTWNTTGYAKGNYVVSAYAWLVQGETDTADNTLTDGWVIVAMAGDINADGIVDIFDCVKIAIAYGATPNDPNWDPDADITNDNIIDIFDLVIIAIHFGETIP